MDQQKCLPAPSSDVSLDSDIYHARSHTTPNQGYSPPPQMDPEERNKFCEMIDEKVGVVIH